MSIDQLPSQYNVQNDKVTVFSELSIDARKFGKWTKEEDDILKNVVQTVGQRSWKKVAELVPGRSAIQCLHRWTKILKPGLIKGPWTIEQDRKLLEWVNREGANQWSLCAEFIKGRSGKQCRERYYNTLNPGVKKGNWTPEEDYIIFEGYRQIGSQWTKIASKLPGRTENSIKNRFYSTLRRIYSQHKASASGEKMSSSLVPKEKLIEYVNDAIVEKTLNFFQYKKEMSSDMEYTSNNNQFLVDNNSNFFNNNSIINNNLGQKSILESNNVPNNNQNIFNINNLIEMNSNIVNNQTQPTNLINFSNKLNEEESKNFTPCENQNSTDYSKYKDMNLDVLEKNIENMCEGNPFNDINSNLLDNQINEFIENFFQNNNFDNEANLLCIGCTDNNKNVTNTKPTNTNILQNSSTQLIQEKANIINNNISNLKGKEDSKVLNSLLDQLNELESLLHTTKSELLSKQKASISSSTSNCTTSTDLSKRC